MKKKKFRIKVYTYKQVCNYACKNGVSISDTFISINVPGWKLPGWVKR